MNVKHILVPVDFSAHSESAVHYATSLAKEYGAELHLLYVYEQPYAYVDGGFAGYVEPADLQPDKDRLASISPPASEVSFTREFIEGNPNDEIIRYAKDKNVDLIVMGTHGRTGLGRLLMGSVAEAVVRGAPCPVLTIKQPISETANA